MPRKHSDASGSSRRSVLKITAVSGIGAVAGCLGGQSGTGGGGGDGEFTLDFATAYTEGTTEHYPVMQKAFIENVEAETDGRIQVNHHPGGVLGAGAELANQVQNNTIQAAQFSFANFSPYASAVDLVNLPYFAGTNQEFVNLVTSDAWNDIVHENVRENGFEPLFYLVIDPRAVAVGDAVDEPILSPSDMAGLRHRVPGSDILSEAWGMVDANPTPVDWGETPSAIQEGVADTVHTAPEAYVAFGFEDIISHVTLTNIVEDAQVYAVNSEWYQSLPEDLQDGLSSAAEQTFEQNLEQVPISRENSYEVLEDNGVEIHSLNDDELEEWRNEMAYDQSDWDDWKVELAGDMETFERLEEATQEQSDFTVDEP
ncbi:TRAP transporter substrate-binding protein [Halosolutus halophilus]|uniref:TRAP transporter substrate-binding protein n=1 Tax=Halosolutus halophilus TaxID=1552990 RepID=UPI0022350E8F|nr:TRAP transporter substrate-binding protein [Halosolutus halophilus]